MDGTTQCRLFNGKCSIRTVETSVICRSDSVPKLTNIKGTFASLSGPHGFSPMLLIDNLTSYLAVALEFDEPQSKAFYTSAR